MGWQSEIRGISWIGQNNFLDMSDEILYEVLKNWNSCTTRFIVEVINIFFMLKSTKHEIHPAH